MKTCKTCLLDLSLDNYRKCGKIGNLQKYRSKCKKCEADTMKNIIIEAKGDSCTLCGYNKCFAALELHHLDPTKKEYQPSLMKEYPKEKILKEINKCILVCANCHRELHAKLIRSK